MSPSVLNLFLFLLLLLLPSSLPRSNAIGLGLLVPPDLDLKLARPHRPQAPPCRFRNGACGVLRVVAITCFWPLRASLGSASYLVALPYLVPAFWLPLFQFPVFQLRASKLASSFFFLSFFPSFLGSKGGESRSEPSFLITPPSPSSVFWILV